MGIYDGSTLEDLKLHLVEMKATYASASTGRQVTSIAKGDKRLSFAPVDLKNLQLQIALLERQIAALENPNATPRRGYAVATFGP